MTIENDDHGQQAEQLARGLAALRADRLRFDLSRALEAGRCLPEGIDDATSLLSTLCAPEFDEDGRIAGLTVGDKRFDTARAAVDAFLEARPHFTAKAKPALVPRRPEQALADGFRTPTAGDKKHAATREGVESDRSVDHSAGELIAKGWATPAK